jgi:branched-subunit amino acid ABC-type transport system permease component
MSTFGLIVRIASCLAVGGACGAVAGISLALLYETLDDPPSMIRLPGLAEVVMGTLFGVLGSLMGE